MRPLYANKAFDRPFVTLLVAFAVMMSGVTSAAAARAFGGDYLATFVSVPTVLAALAFLAAVSLVNFVGIAQSVRVNVVLTVVKASGLLVIVAIGAWALVQGDGDPGRALELSGDGGAQLGLLGGTRAPAEAHAVGAIVVTVTVTAGLVTTGDLAGLADTAVLLLLLVFGVVNVAVLVLRRDPVEHGHFRAPTWAPALGAVACLVLASPLTGRDLTTYARAGLLLGIGVLLWGVNRLAIRRWSPVPPA